MTYSTTGSRLRRDLCRSIAASSVCFALGGAVGCGDKPPAQSPVPPPQGGAVSEQLGAPRDTHYAADIEATRGRVRVILKRGVGVRRHPGAELRGGREEEVRRRQPDEDAAMQRAGRAQRDRLARSQWQYLPAR